MNYLKLFFACVVSPLFLSSCAVQVSALSAYNGPLYEPTNQCQVYRTSLEPRFYEIVQKYEAYMMGDSHVSTNGGYENEEAAYDCMEIGARSVVVLDRGVVASSSGYVPGTTTYNYNPYTNSVYSTHTPGYAYTQNTSAYVVVFFEKEIKKGGNIYTVDDYEDWRKSKGIVGCEGC